MKYLLLLALSIVGLAAAQPVIVEKKVVCEKTQLVIESLQQGKYQEQPVWIGVDPSSRFSLFENKKSQTWSFIQFNQEIACMIAAGEGSMQLFTSPKIND